MLSEAEKKNVVARLKRTEGQVVAIRRMVEEGRYCVDTLLQISAAQAALGQVGKMVLAAHMNSCVAEVFSGGDEGQRRAKIDQLLLVLSRYGHLGARGA